MMKKYRLKLDNKYSIMTRFTDGRLSLSKGVRREIYVQYSEVTKP